MKILPARIPLKEKLFFAEHLAVMLRASIPLDRALTSLAEQTTHKRFRTILAALQEIVKRGEPLSKGLQAHAPAFGDLFISMVSAGELSGKLDESLRRLYVQLKKDYDLVARVKTALTYPAFVIFAMLGIGTTVMLYVIPKLIPLFEGFGAQLPLPTRILIGVSSFLSEYSIWLLLALLIFGFVFTKLVRGRLKKQWHSFLLHLPILGELLKKVNLARFSRTLSTLLSTDILVTDALNITGRVVGNELYKQALALSAATIKQGLPIATSLKSMPHLFPATVQTMIAVGEESGTLAELLAEVAIFYEESVEETTKSLSSIIEPVLIVLLGMAVGGMAIAILTPMYSLMERI